MFVRGERDRGRMPAEWTVIDINGGVTKIGAVVCLNDSSVFWRRFYPFVIRFRYLDDRQNPKAFSAPRYCTTSKYVSNTIYLIAFIRSTIK